MASNKAFLDEINAFEKIKKMLQDTSKAFQEPAGADAGFPDFGFTVSIGTKKIDLHIEYKNAPTAQMGSMRDWKFNGTKFYTGDTANETKAELIELMNGTPAAVQNGKRLLKDLQTYFHKDVKEISSGALSIVKDKQTRYALTLNFVEGTENYQIANITDAAMGNRIITHYKKKFKKSMNPSRATGHVLMMMIKDSIWIVDTAGQVSDNELNTIATMLGASKLNILRGLTANLEVRIQPRGLQSKGAKPTSIDVMASYRLKGGLSGGAKII